MDRNMLITLKLLRVNGCSYLVNMSVTVIDVSIARAEVIT